jgi:molecular chaperone DnaK (HSP70)
MPTSSIKTRISTVAEYRRLGNGKYQGVIVQSSIGRFSSDDFEFFCESARDSKEDALKDARALAEKRNQVLSEPPRITLFDAVQSGLILQF